LHLTQFRHFKNSPYPGLFLKVRWRTSIDMFLSICNHCIYKKVMKKIFQRKKKDSKKVKLISTIAASTPYYIDSNGICYDIKVLSDNSIDSNIIKSLHKKIYLVFNHLEILEKFV